jgi:hypothetical protein
MRKYAIVLGLVLLATSAVWAAAYSDTEQVSQTIKLEPGGTLRLHSFSGRVSITASDQPEVVINAVRHGTRWQLDHSRLDIHTNGANVVVVEATRRERAWYEFIGSGDALETEFDVRVPRKTNLDLSVFSALVNVEGVEGDHQVHGFSSRLSLTDTAGSIRAHTFSGAVVIGEKSWASDRNIQVDTFSGNVELQVPASATGTVSFNTFSGRLDSEVPLVLHSSTRRAVRAELGGGGNGSLRFKTFSGSVKINHQP